MEVIFFFISLGHVSLCLVHILQNIAFCNSNTVEDIFMKPDRKEKKPSITKTCLFKYTENFITKNKKKSDKNSDIFHISGQNIDFSYLLEPPRRGGSNEYPYSMF